MNARTLSLLFRLLSAGSLLAFVDSAVAGSPWFTRVWQTDDGLPNNHVGAIVQGADGYLWIGTSEGLAKFDGTHFTRIPIPSADRDQYQDVQALSVSPGGGLWVAIQHEALVELNSSSAVIKSVTNNLQRNSASAVVEDEDGTVWIAYGNYFSRVQKGRVEQLGARENIPVGSVSFSGLVKDSSGNIWMAKEKRVGIFRDGRFQLMATAGYSGNRALAARLAAARTNGIWIAIGERLLRCTADGHLRDLGAFQAETHRTEASVVLEDDTGGVWIGTDNNGLFRYNQSKFEKIETSHPTILSLAEDNEGNIWVGTGGGGLDRISRSGVQLENFSNGTSQTAIQSICEGEPGIYWGVTGDGQLVRREDSQWLPMSMYPVNSEEVTCVAAGTNGSVFFGTRNRQLHCWIDGRLKTWTRKTGFVSHTVVALLWASNGDVWVGEYGTPNAVQYLHDGVLKTVSIPKKLNDPGRITSMAEDVKGNIWVGTISGSLYCIEGCHFIDESGLLPARRQPILCLYGTADGALWIGFEGFGLGRLRNGDFAEIGTVQGLDDNVISQIVADSEGWLWFGSEHGIFKVRQRELENALNDSTLRICPIRYGRNEGLSSVEADSPDIFPYASPNAIRGSDGKLFIPLRSALAVIDPLVLKEGRQRLPVFITRVTMDGKTVASSDLLESNVIDSKAQSAPLRLPAGHRHLEFSFTAVNFSAPENVHFRYRLEGFDNDWIEAETLRSADYSRLPAGNYAFEVEARNGDGPWNECARPFLMVVPPFIWETWWFRSLALIILLSFVIVIARYISFRRLQQKLKILQQQRALDQERARIARDLHDDLGGSLTEVSLLVKMLDHYQHQPQKVSGAVRQIASTVRHVNESLDQIVWAINPRNDTLPNLIGFMGQSSMEFLRNAGIKCEMDLPDHAPEWILTPEERHNLFLAVKEAINNIVRHSHADEARIQMSLEKRVLKILIQDNGCGMNGSSERYCSDGLRNMRQRMADIAGQCLIDARAGGGTSVSLTFPIRSND